MVKSGEDALRYLEEQTPDLILLDIYLRKMNGYEVMEHMQKSPHLSKIPVILLTAAEQEEEGRSIASGAVDLIRKPFDPQMLLNRIEAVWKREA
jgi:CheY-like chemotaxis protein